MNTFKEGSECIMIGQRLKQLRLARGLSLEALAAEIGGIVTKQALSKYEQGKTRPSPKVLNKLAAALGVKAARLWSEPTICVQFIAYRKGSGLLRKEQLKIESLVKQALEERIHLQELTQSISGADLPVRALSVKTVADAERAAETLRVQWNLGFDPIASIIGVLEDHLIHVLEINAGERFDGISAVAYDDEQRIAAATVVTRRGVAGERQRLNLAHELGHLVLKISKSVDEEQAAFRFGASFLAPADVVRREIGAKRTFIRPDELLLFKRRFGMSLQALLYRLRDLGIITESYYKKWCMDINRLGWRKREPLELAPEQPQWLRQNVLRALAEGLITQEEAERVLGETLEIKPPLSLIHRRAFMKLPLEARRKILAEQAEKMAAHYERDSEWKELQGGDLVEY
jgi:Zn-dependent peptidase ImmA (M78 family)/DNA-binding XRE family transcriptional regulator